MGTPSPPDFSVILAAQQKQAEMLQAIGELLVNTTGRTGQLEERVERLEKGVLGLVEAMRQVHGFLQQALERRRF